MHNKECNSYRDECEISQFNFRQEIISLYQGGTMKSTIFLLTLLSINTAFADTVVLKIKKSYHPKNVLNYSVTTNTKCELEKKAGVYVTPLWFMGENGGGTEGLTSTEKTYYLPKESYINTQKNEVDFSLGAMEQVKTYISDPKITIRTQVIDGKCVSEALMNIDKQEVTITEVFISGTLTFPMSWKTDYITFSGFQSDGKPFTKKIQIRK